MSNIIMSSFDKEVFHWSALFHEKINTWKFSPKERLGITGLYILTVVIPTPFISLYWIRYNDTKKIVIPEAVLTYFHVTLVLGILWLCTIRLSYSKFMFQQAAELQKIIIIILAIPGSIPISLMYSYSQDTVSIANDSNNHRSSINYRIFVCAFGHQFSLRLNVFYITAPGLHFSAFF